MKKVMDKVFYNFIITHNYIRTLEITKLGYTCNFQQIDPFQGQKTSFLQLSRHPEVQFEQTFFCFVGFNKLYKIKKFVRIGSLVVEIIEKIVSANCINFGKIGYLKNMTYFRDFRGPIISHQESKSYRVKNVIFAPVRLSFL